MPRLSTVISASVRSGSISEIAPTNVVLPTAKPPATTIFIDDRHGRIAAVSRPERRTGQRARMPSSSLFKQDDVGRGVRSAGVATTTAPATRRGRRRARGPRRPAAAGRAASSAIETGADAQLDDAPRLGRARPRRAASGGQHARLGASSARSRAGAPGAALRDDVRADERVDGGRLGAIGSPIIVIAGSAVWSSATSAGVSASRAPLDEHRHLVADEADVARPGRDDGEHRRVADAHHEQQRTFELHDDLVHGAAVERRGRAPGDALEAGGDGRQPVGRDAVETVRHRDQQTVRRDDDGLAHAGHAAARSSRRAS